MARAIGETDIDRIYEHIRAGARLLEDDVVVHGDFCLPNVFFDGEYRFTGFIDLGMAGRGDRHYDLYWGRWTLRYNLGTDAYGDAFFDAYGAARHRSRAHRGGGPYLLPGRMRPLSDPDHASNTHRPPVNVASTRVLCTSSGAHESTSRSSTATSASMPGSSIPSSCARPAAVALPCV